jgi:hypothetical protein
VHALSQAALARRAWTWGRFAIRLDPDELETSGKLGICGKTRQLQAAKNLETDVRLRRVRSEKHTAIRFVPEEG